MGDVVKMFAPEMLKEQIERHVAEIEKDLEGWRNKTIALGDFREISKESYEAVLKEMPLHFWDIIYKDTIFQMAMLRECSMPPSKQEVCELLSRLMGLSA